MARTITIRLSEKSISNAIKELQDYKKELNRNIEVFLNKLAEKGIVFAKNAARGDSHHFDGMVEFVKETREGTIYLIGRNANLSGLHTEWYDGEGNHHTETISPIYALEWGTAGQAIKGHGGSAAVTGNHVNDDFWYYYTSLDKNGKPDKATMHVATSEEAHEPMYNAALEMRKVILETAREVWGEK